MSIIQSIREENQAIVGVLHQQNKDVIDKIAELTQAVMEIQETIRVLNLYGIEINAAIDRMK